MCTKNTQVTQNGRIYTKVYPTSKEDLKPQKIRKNVLDETRERFIKIQSGTLT
jgi:hypothetical protein